MKHLKKFESFSTNEGHTYGVDDIQFELYHAATIIAAYASGWYVASEKEVPNKFKDQVLQGWNKWCADDSRMGPGKNEEVTSENFEEFVLSKYKGSQSHFGFSTSNPGNEHKVAYEILEKINRKFDLFKESSEMDIESFNHPKYNNIDNMYDTVFSGDGIVDVILNVKRM